MFLKVQDLFSFCICIALIFTGCFGKYVNNWDERFTVFCPASKLVSYISSYHSNYYEDRRWEFRCRDAGKKLGCVDSGYVNTFDNPINFRCPGNQVVTGVTSFHDNFFEDRRFGFRCCSFLGRQPRNCYNTGNVNNWDGLLTLNVPVGKAIKGVFSKHNNFYEDRLWQFEICSF